MMLSVFFAGAGACKGIIDGKTLGEILPFYLMSFLGLYLYFSVSGLVDVHGKKAALKTSLTDYLENHMAARLSLLDESEWLAGAEVRSVSAGGAILREMESIGEEQDKIQAEAEQTTVKQSAGKLIAAELKEKIRPERAETMEKSPAETQMEEQIFTGRASEGVFCIIQHCWQKQKKCRIQKTVFLTKKEKTRKNKASYKNS